MPRDSFLPRRRFLRQMGVSALGLSLADFLGAQASAPASGGRARSCIVLYCWGGMSHLETWDLKPDAPVEYRGEFRPIATRVPGIRVGEHIPLLAQHTDKLAVIRSIHHRSSAHGKGMYWNWTGHAPTAPEVAINMPPTRTDWPSLGAMVARFRHAPAGFPSAVQLPYPMVDNNTRQAGENAGWLGQAYDPVIVRPDRGRPYGGVSRDLGALVINPASGVETQRLHERQSLRGVLDQGFAVPVSRSFEQCCAMANDVLTSPRVQAAFNLDLEPMAVRQHYGEHICGQSVLLARRLLEAGVPIATVICAAGDLNGSAGDMWDTHGDNFTRLRRDLLPPFDAAASALLTDLAERGRLDDTLVVILTEFGRTPRINRSAGRDHYPLCYSVALAGGGIRGGQVYGASDRIGALPAEQPCEPNDLHATIFHALGIPLDATLVDQAGRSFPITDGRVLPLF
jgi:uncharacterized protein (DUF1501 family)